MSDSNKPLVDHPSDDGFVGTGRPLKSLLYGPPLSEEELKRHEEAWNNTAAFNAAVMAHHPALNAERAQTPAGGMPRPTVDPNRTLVPSEAEVAKLPRWASVALVARCARRVLPLAADWLRRNGVAIERDLKIFDHAVCTAEIAAATASGDLFNVHIFTGEVLRCAAQSAERRDASSAIRDTFLALGSVVTVGTLEYLAAPARDFERLQQWLAKQEKWTNDTPVPQSVFGPMWEGTPPEWWTDDILAGLPPEAAEDKSAPEKGRTAESGTSSPTELASKTD